MRVLLGMSKNKKSHLGHSLRMVTSRDMLDCSLHILLSSHSSLCCSLSNLNFKLLKSVVVNANSCARVRTTNHAENE